MPADFFPKCAYDDFLRPNFYISTIIKWVTIYLVFNIFIGISDGQINLKIYSLQYSALEHI